MSQIVGMDMDNAGARIGFDQDLIALARLAEESPIGLAALGHTDMASGHTWRDPVGVIPISGDFARPVTGFVFDRAQSTQHAFCPGGWLGMVRRDLGGLDLDYIFPTPMALALVPIILIAAFVAALGPAEAAVRGSLVEALEYE